MGESERHVYVPLRIGQQANPLQTGHYQIVLLPGHELTEVYISLASVGADGRPGAFRPDGKALGYGYYPAGRGVTISIPNLEEPGIYYLEIGAVLKGGGATTAEVWFYHRGR